MLCGDIRGSEGVGRDRGCRQATAPAVEEDAGSRAAPAVEVDLRGWGGTRERRVWSAAAQEKGGGQEKGRGSECGEEGLVFRCFYTIGERLEPLDRRWTVRNGWAI